MFSKLSSYFQAYDLGSPAKMSYKLFEITLIDIDDNQPKFNQSSYKFDILEGRGIGWEVGRVTAVDPDIDGCVRYYAADDDIYKAIFKVNETTGVIKTLRDFDYETEKQKEFYFEILAKACKKPEQVALARANIQLIDENDNRWALMFRKQLLQDGDFNLLFYSRILVKNLFVVMGNIFFGCG